MTTRDDTNRKIQLNDALEISIQIGLAALLVVGCLLILRPFIPLILWGIIIAIASYPAFLKLQRLLKGRGALAAALWTLLLLAILIVPMVLLGQQLVEALSPLVAHLRDGTLVLPPPPASVEHWPIIGVPLSRAWSTASTHLTETLVRFAPEIKSALPAILAASAGFGSTLLQFFLSIVVSGVLLAKAKPAADVTRSLVIRLLGERGPEYHERVVGHLSLCRHSSSRCSRACSSSHLRIRHCHNDESCDFPDLVHDRWVDGQCVEARASGEGLRRSGRRGLSRRDRWIRCHGHHGSVCRRDCPIGRLQAVSGLDRRGHHAIVEVSYGRNREFFRR